MTHNENLLQPRQVGENCFFLDGPAGTGKSFLYTSFIYWLKTINRTAITVAWTGIAANLLPEGTTVHTRFRLPVSGLDESSTIGLEPTSKSAEEIRQASILIWDEVSMASRYALEAVERGLRDIALPEKKHLPFGGLLVVLGGDFRQTAPVVRKSSRAQQCATSVRYSGLWRYFQPRILRLRMNMRSSEPEFADWLLNVGNGTRELINPDAEHPFKVFLNHHYICSSSDPEIIITKIYGPLVNQRENDNIINDNGSGILTDNVILCLTNEETFLYNERIQRYITVQNPSTDIRTYYSVDQISDNCNHRQNAVNPLHFPSEVLHSLTPNGLPTHQLEIKVNSVVMLIRNLHTKKGLCNGTRLIVLKLYPRSILGRILTGTHIGKEVLIPRIIIESDDQLFPFKFQRTQIPVRLAFALTINKSQGQSFNKVGVILNKSVFSHGQLYVALSRCRTSNGLTIAIPNIESPYLDNVVYPELLL
jgi:hypothetical protein